MKPEIQHIVEFIEQIEKGSGKILNEQEIRKVFHMLIEKVEGMKKKFKKS